MRADPDTFVVLFPVDWHLDRSDEIERIHQTHWQEDLAIDADPLPEDEEATARGHLQLSDNASAELLVEPPIEEMTEAAGTGKEPMQPSEYARLEQHTAIWRISVGDDEAAIGGALAAGRLMATLARAGAAGAFVPALLQLHSPSFIETQTMKLNHERALCNLFVAAWDDGDWMMSRGLTAFGHPELETPVDSGLNAAYFRLMDIASNTIAREEAYPVGANLEVGGEQYRLEEGRRGPEDERAAVNGAFGTRSIVPAT